MSDAAPVAEASQKESARGRVPLVIAIVALVAAGAAIAVVGANESSGSAGGSGEGVVERRGDDLVVRWTGATDATMRDSFARLEVRRGERWQPAYRLFPAQEGEAPWSMSYTQAYQAQDIVKWRTTPDRFRLPQRLAAADYRICSETFDDDVDAGGPPRTLCARIPR